MLKYLLGARKGKINLAYLAADSEGKINLALLICPEG